MGKGCRVTQAWEVQITHMGGLDNLTVRESDVEWVVRFAFIADGYIGEEEVCSGTGINNGFIGTECDVGGVGGGSNGGGGI
jgi:hypothetical protein